MQLHVTNAPVAIGSIRIIGVSSSSSFLIGDTESITLSSFFDTPPESVIVGPLAPLPSLPEETAEQSP
ncbi:spore gernimation protein GerPD [Cohnella sp. REN36]|uniref:spore gernimation protein GerPD n=1 Tax=Cohnella sp. REN36 TaxID=2887347 RepID=UPI001D13C992|nr:spore gernimation protein GerPD [Cohnella sp. REN36]MCC3373356.1 spore gernimation protein GerPD [Cohnella sp. REN36]